MQRDLSATTRFLGCGAITNYATLRGTAPELECTNKKNVQEGKVATLPRAGLRSRQKRLRNALPDWSPFPCAVFSNHTYCVITLAMHAYGTLYCGKNAHNPAP